MEHAYKFRIYPSTEQRNVIERIFGCCRYVYNHYLEERTKAYQETGKAPTRFEQERDLTELKRKEATLWLKEADVTALQASIKDLDVAFQNFYRRVKKGEKLGYPHFKSKRSPRQSYKSKRTGTNIKVLDGAVQLPKLGLVKCRVSKAVDGRILSATVSRNPAGKYFVSICCTDVDHQPFAKTGAAPLALSAAEIDAQNRENIRKSYRQLARLQRSLSRKSRGSNNRRKAKEKVERMYERIGNQRCDMLHKLSTELLHSHDVISVGGTDPSGERGAHRSADALADWRELRRQLSYKAAWYGKSVTESETASLSRPPRRTASKRDADTALAIRQEGPRLLA